jgi:hypothetical protein
MEGKDIGGAIAGGLIATALMETLVAKGVLTADDARNVLIKARRTIGNSKIDSEQQGAALLDTLLSLYPEHRFDE